MIIPSTGWKNGWIQTRKSDVNDTPEITAPMLLYAYASGVFPMAESAESDEILWIDPEKRGIIPLDQLHISGSLKKLLVSNRYSVGVDTCFDDVLSACADRKETWINPQIFDLYLELHQLGYAHSVEVFENEHLVGGLYGVAIEGAFFGESMFSSQPSASKVALVALVARLRRGGYFLLDTQFLTPHLETMGGVEITKAAYQAQLEIAMQTEASFDQLQFSDTASIWQLITQIS